MGKDHLEELSGLSEQDTEPTEEEEREEAQIVTMEGSPEPSSSQEPEPEPSPEPQPEPLEDRLTAMEKLYQSQIETLESQRQQERQGFLQTIESLRRQRDERPPEPPPASAVPPKGIPVRFDEQGEAYVPPEELATFLQQNAPQPQAAPAMDSNFAMMQARQMAAAQVINQDPQANGPAVQQFFQLYDELDREVSAANAMRPSAQPFRNIDEAVAFAEQSGAAQRFQQRYSNIFPDVSSVLDFAEAGTSLVPRKLERAVNGLRYQLAPRPEPKPQETPSEERQPTNGGPQRLPVERPRPMGQRGRAPTPSKTGREARLQELMDKDPFRMTDEEGEEMGQLISEVEREEEERARATQAT